MCRYVCPHYYHAQSRYVLGAVRFHFVFKVLQNAFGDDVADAFDQLRVLQMLTAQIKLGGKKEKNENFVCERNEEEKSKRKKLM